jgi:hypothetical protein
MTPGGKREKTNVFEWYSRIVLLFAVGLAVIGAVVAGSDTGTAVRLLSVAVGLYLSELLGERLYLAGRISTFIKSVEPTVDQIAADTVVLRDHVENTLVPAVVDTRIRTTTVLEHVNSYVVPRFVLDRRRPGDNPVFQRLKLSWADRTTVHPTGRWMSANRRDSIELWQDCLHKSRTWNALSLARDLWRNDEQRISDAHQGLHRQLMGPGSIKRVFVIETAQDLPALAPVIRTQAERFGHGHIKWIMRADLEQEIGDGPKSEADIGFDFALANDNFVLVFDLTGALLTGARLTDDRHLVATARSRFDDAWGGGQEADQLP